MATTLGPLSVSLGASTTLFVNRIGQYAGSLGKFKTDTDNIVRRSTDRMDSEFRTAADGIERELGRIDKSITGFIREIRGIGPAFRIGAAVVTPIAVAAGGMALLANRFKAAAAPIDDLATTAQRLGLTTRQMQAIALGAEQAGISFEVLNDSLRQFNTNLFNASGQDRFSKTLGQLGLDVGSLQELDVNTRLSVIADALAQVEDVSQQAAVAVALFGESGRDLVTLLRGGSDTLNDYSDLVEQTGLALGEDAVARVQAAVISLNALQNQLGAVNRQLLAAFAPLVQTIAELSTETIETSNFGQQWAQGSANIILDTLAFTETAYARGRQVWLQFLAILNDGAALILEATEALVKGVEDIVEQSSRVFERASDTLRSGVDAAWDRLMEMVTRLSEAVTGLPEVGGRVATGVVDGLMGAILRVFPQAEMAAAIYGNLIQESGGDPTAENQIGAFGLAQWLGPRRSALEQFARDRGLDARDANTQLLFMRHELQTTERRAADRIQPFLDAGDVEGAARAFSRYYERPGAHEANNDRRAAVAREAYSEVLGRAAAGRREAADRQRAEAAAVNTESRIRQLVENAQRQTAPERALTGALLPPFEEESEFELKNKGRDKERFARIAARRRDQLDRETQSVLDQVTATEQANQLQRMRNEMLEAGDTGIEQTLRAYEAEFDVQMQIADSLLDLIEVYQDGAINLEEFEVRQRQLAEVGARLADTTRLSLDLEAEQERVDTYMQLRDQLEQQIRSYEELSLIEELMAEAKARGIDLTEAQIADLTRLAQEYDLVAARMEALNQQVELAESISSTVENATTQFFSSIIVRGQSAQEALGQFFDNLFNNLLNLTLQTAFGGLLGFQRGGFIPETGIYILHAGERILNRQEVADIEKTQQRIRVENLNGSRVSAVRLPTGELAITVANS